MISGYAGVVVPVVYLSPPHPSLARLFAIARVVNIFRASSLEQGPEIEILVDFDEKRVIERGIGSA